MLELTVVLGESYKPGQRWATIALGNVPIFTELVYDNREAPAELNIVRLFAGRLQRLLSED